MIFNSLLCLIWTARCLGVTLVKCEHLEYLQTADNVVWLKWDADNNSCQVICCEWQEDVCSQYIIKSWLYIWHFDSKPAQLKFNWKSYESTMLNSVRNIRCQWGLGKPSLKKSVTFFTLGSDPPPLFSGKCNENPKKNKAFRVQY